MRVPGMSARVYDCVCRCSLSTLVNPHVCACVCEHTCSHGHAQVWSAMLLQRRNEACRSA
eukprot:6570842-Alexandrium_andersonii.AAC.1